MAGEMASTSTRTSGTDLIGAVVENPRGEILGVINDFVEEPDGRITFAIINFGRYEDYGEGGRMVAVPWGTLSCAARTARSTPAMKNWPLRRCFLEG